MSRVVVTGLGCLCTAGVGGTALQDALASDRPLGTPVSVEGPRRGSGRRRMRVGYLPSLPREDFLPARRLRRMGEASQIWTVAALLARADALGGNPGGLPPPGRRGMVVGTAFGGVDTTWEYVGGLLRDGLPAASPFLFSESIANAPAGHASIELDTRGLSVTFTCADISAVSAVDWAGRAIAQERLDLAYAGGIDLMPEALLRILAATGAPDFVGEGAVCLVLESLRSARERGARILAEIAGSALASDADAAPNGYGRNPRPLESALRRARERLVPAAAGTAGGTPGIGRIYLQACGDLPAEAAERQAVAAVCPEAETERVSSRLGAFAAGGGLGLAAAVAGLARQPGKDFPAALVSGHAWGGGIAVLALRAVTD